MQNKTRYLLLIMFTLVSVFTFGISAKAELTKSGNVLLDTRKRTRMARMRPHSDDYRLTAL